MKSSPVRTARTVRTALMVWMLWIFLIPLSGQHMPFLQYMDHPWVDSVLATLSPEQKEAQCVWILTGPDRPVEHYVRMERLIREYGIGGVVISGDSQGKPGELEDLVSYYRSVGRVPLAVATESFRQFGPESGDFPSVNEDLIVRQGKEDGKGEGEGVGKGEGDGLNANPGHGYGDVTYPGTLAMRAIDNDTLLTQLGFHWSRRLIDLGSQVLLEPVHEINVEEVFRGRHQLLSAKYQPGRDASRMDRAMSEVSGFSSMIAADAARTTGLAACFEPDVLRLDPTQAEQFAGEISSRLEAAGLDEAVINQRARMVLAFKYWAGLATSYPPGLASDHSGIQGDLPGLPDDLSGLPDDLSGLPGELSNEDEFVTGSVAADRQALIRDLWAGAITVLNNQWEALPLKELDRKRIACLAVNRQSPTAFQQMAGNYTRTSNYSWFPGMEGQDSLMKILASYDVVLAGVYWPGPVTGVDRTARAETERLLRALSEQTYLISSWFGPPETLEEEYSFLQESEGLLLTYEENIMTGELAAQLIFGGIGGKGRLPLAIGNEYQAGSGIRTEGNLRLQYAFPENAGLSSTFLDRRIDSIVKSGLVAGAFPGCEVMAARDGKVIFHRSYGYHTYAQRVEVMKGDLYDLASVTKVSAPLAGLMVLEGMDSFSYTGRLGDYTDAMKHSDKADLPLKDILAHQAGLYPWIPYWQDAVRNNGKYKWRFFRMEPSTRFSTDVADHLYLKNNYRKKIYRSIRKSELGEKTYVYSGLSFFIFPEIITDLSGEPYEDFLKEKVYYRLGAYDLTFNPLRYYPASRIVPTEYDSLFRKQQIHGFVHDEGAAMMGGYSGNAGLFSTANDLLKLFEMYRRMGTYGGEEIIPADVLHEYTGYQFPETGNRRGLGFDKPLVDGRDGTPGDYPCPGASPASFGHSGFTGTFAWSDPAYGITYVFLSNRVYPTRNNNLLSEMDIRTNILQALYDAIHLAEPDRREP